MEPKRTISIDHLSSRLRVVRRAYRIVSSSYKPDEGFPITDDDVTEQRVVSVDNTVGKSK
ncbi:hypothetical protein M408DRAFT_283666 [Serendipita vermifera MAFF 305830]|uniref:Uncharacterized protein n=1 Tax=Serendipita vermifera MAFF 305830 TaxID=933852 RepID=A0A0C3ACX1_SERVB|nr:hypothetical protein M408DRAFT_283666 [Serendipita vermifera MAFF 305830]